MTPHRSLSNMMAMVMAMVMTCPRMLWQEEAARVQQARVRVEADLRQVGRQHKDVLQLKVHRPSLMIDSLPILSWLFVSSWLSSVDTECYLKRALTLPSALVMMFTQSSTINKPRLLLRAVYLS